MKKIIPVLGLAGALWAGVHFLGKNREETEQHSSIAAGSRTNVDPPPTPAFAAVSELSSSKPIEGNKPKTTSEKPLADAASVSPKDSILDPGVKDFKELLRDASRNDTAAQISVYQWLDYCQSHVKQKSSGPSVCEGIEAASENKREMILKAAENADWRALESLFAEYATAVNEPSTPEVDSFRSRAMSIFLRAASMSVAEGAKYVSLIYFHGLGVPKDPAIAYAYIERYAIGRHDETATAMLSALKPALRQGDWIKVREVQREIWRDF